MSRHDLKALGFGRIAAGCALAAAYAIPMPDFTKFVLVAVVGVGATLFMLNR